MSDKKFVKDLISVLGGIVDEANGEVGEEHVTTRKVIEAAAEQGKHLRHNTARALIQKRVDGGLLCYDGKRKDPKTGKVVSVWVLAAKP